MTIFIFHSTIPLIFTLLPCGILDIIKSFVQNWLWFVLLGSLFMDLCVFFFGNQQPKPVTSMFICLHAIVLDCDVLIPVQHVLFYNQVFSCKQPLSSIRYVFTSTSITGLVRQWCFVLRLSQVSVRCHFFPSSLCTQAPREHLCGPIRCVLPATSCSRVT